MGVDIHEAARQAILAIVRGTVPDAERNAINQVGELQPGMLAATVEDGQPQLVDELLSPHRLIYDQQVLIGVAAAEATQQQARAALTDALIAIAAAIEADRTLGGLVQTLQLSAPAETQETLTMGGPDAAAKLMPVILAYSTGPNPMEALP
ncbi:MAG: hypothetical protein AAFW01_00035 [Pseudomonadota bacterium]